MRAVVAAKLAREGRAHHVAPRGEVGEEAPVRLEARVVKPVRVGNVREGASRALGEDRVDDLLTARRADS